jgi:hypothetical protein
MAKSKTSAQIIVDTTSGELPLPSMGTFNYAKARIMRRDPTISLARDLSVAAIMGGSWSVEGDDEEHKHFVRQQIAPLREQIVRPSFLGMFDFGWKALEAVFDKQEVIFPDEAGGEKKRKLYGIEQIKPLKNDNTRARYRKEDGEFLGFRTTDFYSGLDLLIDAEHALFFNFDDEGLGDYAEGKLQRIEAAYDQWSECNEVANRYDKKMAGTFLVVYYPVGTTPYNGKETENFEIASDIIKAIKTSGAVAVPQFVQQLVSDLNKQQRAWEIEFLDPQGRQAQFVDRLKYLDALKVRGTGVPERAVLEGEFGTKAEAAIHANLALMNIYLQDVYMVSYLNRELVDLLLEKNFARKGSARLAAQPLSDERRGMFMQLFTALLTDPGTAPELLDSLDLQELLTAMGVPMKTSEEAVEETDGAPERELTGRDGRVPAPASNGSANGSANGMPRSVKVQIG